MAETCAIGVQPGLMQAGLRALLENDLGLSVETCCESFGTLTTWLVRAPDTPLVVLDEHLPGLYGPESVRDLRIACPRVRVAVLGIANDRERILTFLSAGAHGYVPRTMRANDLAMAVKAILRGQIYVPSLVADIATHSGAAGTVPASLNCDITRRQHDVIRLMIEGQSNKQIARTLRIAEGTVKAHINAVFRALGVHNRLSAIAALREMNGSSVEARESVLPGLFDGRGVAD